MAFILYQTLDGPDKPLMGTRQIGVTSTHNFATGEIDDDVITRTPFDRWIQYITEGEANCVGWLWTARDYKKVVYANEDPLGRELEFIEKEDGTGKYKIEKSDQEMVDSLSLGKKVKQKINADVYEREYNKLMSTESKQDTALWRTQLQEAKSYIVDNSASTPVLDILLAAKSGSLTLSQLSNNVVTASSNHDIKVAELLLKQQVVNDEIKNATTIAELMAIRPDGN